MRPSIRMSALMNIPVTYIFTHDTYLIGEDGTTHQPIEQLGSLRMIPNLTVYRPCDYKELIGSWNLILKSNKPAALVVSKFHTKALENSSHEQVKNGAYIVSEVKNALDLIIIATGSEVPLALRVKEELLKNYIEARVVSMPSVELFLKQDENYQQQILPEGYRRIVIEFSNDPIFYQFVDNKNDLINIDHFGKSGNRDELAQDFGLDITSIVIRIKNSL
jgi:transketolase